jgi:hypothetical protein
LVFSEHPARLQTTIVQALEQFTDKADVKSVISDNCGGKIRAESKVCAYLDKEEDDN